MEALAAVAILFLLIVAALFVGVMFWSFLELLKWNGR